MCPTGRSSSDGTLDRPGEAVCVRLLSSLLIKNIKASVPARFSTDYRPQGESLKGSASETTRQGTGIDSVLTEDFKGDFLLDNL